MSNFIILSLSPSPIFKLDINIGNDNPYKNNAFCNQKTIKIFSRFFISTYIRIIVGITNKNIPIPNEIFLHHTS